MKNGHATTHAELTMRKPASEWQGLLLCVYINGSKTSIAEQQKMNTQRMQQHGDR